MREGEEREGGKGKENEGKRKKDDISSPLV